MFYFKTLQSGPGLTRHEIDINLLCVKVWGGKFCRCTDIMVGNLVDHKLVQLISSDFREFIFKGNC